ncbi:MAG: radical SAM protein [Actinobacteria bacterium]|nr:radical SAM protein [Actinomycetota bacterium]
MEQVAWQLVVILIMQGLSREIALKAALLTEGVWATPEALAGLGILFKEQNHGLFGWDFEDHEEELLPDDFRLPLGTVVQFRKNGRSPYSVQKHGDVLVLEKNGEALTEVFWLDRPEYYSRATSDGKPMVKVAQIGGEDSFFVCYNNFCSHWSDGRQCLFCNLVPTISRYRSVLGRKQFDHIGEVAAAAFEEGAANHVLLTGGCFPGENETEIVVDILDSIRKQTGLRRIPGCVLASPPKRLEEIEELYEAGIDGVGYSLEIWDERLFNGICPGKAESPGREWFLETFDKAVEVFGRGNVFCAFVTGIEPQETLLEGVEYMAERGVYSLAFVWSPAPGSKLAGHRTPTVEWYLEAVSKMVDSFEKHNLPDSPNHCYRCDGNTLFHDEARLRAENLSLNRP